MKEKLYLKLLRAFSVIYKVGGFTLMRLGINEKSAVRVDSFLRRIVAHLLARVTSSFDIKGHQMFLNSNDDLSALLYLGFFEPMETDLIRKAIKPGDVVLDIGANIGYYTLIFAKLVGPKGKVVAFEPDPVNFALLEKNVKANGYQNVILERKALSNENRTVDLYLCEDNKGMHRIYPSAYCKGAVEVEAVKLDDYFSRYRGKIDFIKMDVEGAEPSVIEGGSSLLKKNGSLMMLIEYAPYAIKEFGLDPEDYLALVKRQGFELYYYDYDELRLESISTSKLRELCPPDQQRIMNLLCVK